MAFTAASVLIVYAKCLQMIKKQKTINKAALQVTDEPDVDISDAERDAIRARLQTDIQALRADIIAQVSTW